MWASLIFPDCNHLYQLPLPKKKERKKKNRVGRLWWTTHTHGIPLVVSLCHPRLTCSPRWLCPTLPTASTIWTRKRKRGRNQELLISCQCLVFFLFSHCHPSRLPHLNHGEKVFTFNLAIKITVRNVSYILKFGFGFPNFKLFVCCLES